MVDRLQACLGIDDHHVDPTISKPTLQSGGESSSQGGAILQHSIGLDQQVDVAAPQAVVQPRAEERDTRRGAKQLGRRLADHALLVIGQAHSFSLSLSLRSCTCLTYRWNARITACLTQLP